ncbi:MAG: DnaT-like ssDNA-binding protein [Fusobacteriaceae bacterium]
MIGYVTLEEAKEFLAKRFETVPGDEKLSMNLQLAFDKIEMLDVRNRGQVNIFPRIGELEVPSNIKSAQILEAYSMTITKATVSSDNIKSKSDGDFSVTYTDSKLNGVDYSNKATYDILRRYRRRSF